MHTGLRHVLMAATALAASPARAAEDRWSFHFGQGVGDYAVGSFADNQSHLALSCAEAGVTLGSVSVHLARAGFAAAAPADATFITDRGRATLRLGADGSARFPSLSAAPAFRRLWTLLAAAKSLQVAYGPGAPFRLPVTGAAALLGGSVCPRQLAG